MRSLLNRMESTWQHVGNDTQLFVDNALIECTQGLKRRWGKPERFRPEPLIVADRSWEHTPYFTYSNYVVLRDPVDGLTKCWYEDIGPLEGCKGHPWKTRLLYAESEDGITFHKPELDVCVVDGKPTNIVMGYEGEGAQPGKLNPWADAGVHSNGIVIDPNASDPEQRFRTIFQRSTFNPDSQAHVCHVTQCAHSADGKHWKPYSEAPTMGSSHQRLGDVSCLHYDEDARMFVQNTRHAFMYGRLPDVTPNMNGWFASYYPHRFDLMNKRRVYQTRSHDFLHWSDPVPVSTPDDDWDNLDEAHYGMQQFRVGRMHFGTLGILRFVENEMDVRLVQSRDGICFTPTDRSLPFLSPCGEDHWDQHMVSITSQPIEQGDHWLFYHGGASCHHDYWMSPKEDIGAPEARYPDTHVKFGLGVVRLRKEGLAYLDGSDIRLGYVKTRPIMSDGTLLRINARCRAGGSVRVGVLDHNDQPVNNCTTEACDTFDGDSTAHTVTWRGTATIGAPGQWRKLLFLVNNAELYSYRLEA